VRQISKFAVVLGITTIIVVRSGDVRPSHAAETSVTFTGVNIADAAFGAEFTPGTFGRDYTYPQPSTLKYFADKGMNIIRLPVLWERLQHQLQGDLDSEEMRRVDTVINYAGSLGIRVIIDVHNYAKYSGTVIGTPLVPLDAFGDLWRRLATRYRDNELVVFGLMNEPNGLRTETWLDAVNLAIAEIRRAGAKNLVLVPGNGWSAARSWMKGHYGTPNGEVMLKVVDQADNYAFDVHQYFDWDYTGTHADCQSTDIGTRTLTPFTQWAREHHKRGFLGEFGVGPGQTCLEALDRVLRYEAANNDVWLGWTYWAAGEWWRKDYFTNIQPVDGHDRPQMAVLQKYSRDDRR